MLTAPQIKMIHIAKTAAGISQERYREILRSVAGVESSTAAELNNRDCDAILKALKPRRESGWQDGQLKMFRKYAGYCKMGLDEARQLLFRVTDQMNEESPGLDQHQFEMVMAELEVMLEVKVGNGTVSVPSGVDLGHWRSRLPGAKINSRQVYEIELTWSALLPYLPEDKRTNTYLRSILASACRLKYLDDIQLLSAFRAITAIEALKLRLKQEQTKLAETVPF